MPFQYLTNVPLERAVTGYIEALIEKGLKPKTEKIQVKDACGRITAKAIYANICAPHYNASAMDGIALKAKITFGATETTPIFLKDNQFVRIDTGDPIPENCDAVVMIEDVVESDGGINLYSAAVPWQHIRQIGEDICAGDMVLPSYSTVTPSAMGAMLASGVMEFEAVKKPVVGIIPTGDEIILPTENPKEGDIIEFNSVIFSGMLSQWGAVAKTYPIVEDQYDKIVESLKKAISECDVVIINAGSSAGREDFSAKAVSDIGEVLYHGIAIKPGKPAILGLSGEKPILGVPGYPVSGIIVLEKILKPIINLLTKKPIEQAETVQAVLSRRLNSSLKYREFIRTRLGNVEGRLVCVPLNKGAGVISSFVKADGIIDVPQNKEGYEAGDTVNVSLIRPCSEIESMIVTTGSHDPLIDEVSDILRIASGDSVASSHVGSMGGITAIKRKEAHMGGIHLLSEDDGTYNINYLKKYFKPGEVVLIECVKRVQGLMVPSGNPMGIRSIGDLERDEIRFINRQKGSGTRILLDYLLKSARIDPSKIVGYEREEFTHTGVTALVASGSGNVGLGIYSAANLYGLDFITVFEEQYDLIVLKTALEMPSVQRFLKVLTGKEFARRLTSMGGYSLENPGRVIEWN